MCRRRISVCRSRVRTSRIITGTDQLPFMVTLISRRAALLGAAVLFCGDAFAEEETSARFRARMSELERRHGGRLGVSLFDTQSGLRFAFRGDELFPMCSTFKFLLAAAILQRVDAKSDQLDRPIAYGAGDIEAYAPITKGHLGEGAMSLAELCAAAMIWSDNSAANLLLRELGGPEALTRFIRRLGDNVTRADRTEPTLNTALPDDPRDTTHPAAMIDDMNAILLGEALSPASRASRLDDRRANRAEAPTRRFARGLARRRQDRQRRQRDRKHDRSAVSSGARADFGRTVLHSVECIRSGA